MVDISEQFRLEEKEKTFFSIDEKLQENKLLSEVRKQILHWLKEDDWDPNWSLEELSNLMSLYPDGKVNPELEQHYLDELNPIESEDDSSGDELSPRSPTDLSEVQNWSRPAPPQWT